MRAPEIDWPSEFIENGPQADPSILLSGDLRIGKASYLVTAVRMNARVTEPDYRVGVSSRLYDEAFAEVQDELEFIMGSMSPVMLRLSDGHYLLWIVPVNLD